MRLVDMGIGDMERYAYVMASSRRDAMADAGIDEDECERAYRKTYASIETAWYEAGDDGYDRMVCDGDDY